MEPENNAAQTADGEQQPAAPQEKKSQTKKIVIGIIVLLVAVIGVLTFLLLQDSDDMSVNSEQSQESEMSAPEETTDASDEAKLNFDGSVPPEVPENYMLYEGDGFSFYYPDSWGELAVGSEDGAEILSATFSTRDDVLLFLNSGSQDLSGGGRGGALWDCIGYTFIGDKEYSCVAAYIGEDGKRISGSVIEDANIVQTRDALDFVLVRDYIYFEENVSEVLFNPSSSKYYGGTLLIKEPTSDDKAELETVAQLFSTDIPDGL